MLSWSPGRTPMRPMIPNNDWLAAAAANEGGRAIHSMKASSLDTVYYFAREAGHYGRELLARLNHESWAYEQGYAAGQQLERIPGMTPALVQQAIEHVVALPASAWKHGFLVATETD